jgi:hypothetical protein
VVSTATPTSPSNSPYPAHRLRKTTSASSVSVSDGSMFRQHRLVDNTSILSRHRPSAQHRPVPHCNPLLPLGPTPSGQPLLIPHLPHCAHIPTRRARVPPLLPLPLPRLRSRVYTNPGQESPTALRLSIRLWIPIRLHPAPHVPLLCPPTSSLPGLFRRRPICPPDPSRVARQKSPECSPPNRSLVLRSSSGIPFPLALRTICREFRLVQRRTTSISRPTSERIARSRRGESSFFRMMIIINSHNSFTGPPFRSFSTPNPPTEHQPRTSLQGVHPPLRITISVSPPSSPPLP